MEIRSLEQLGDEIAELSAHLDAATVRLLDLIREFDIREGWGNGFRSCAAWLSWRVGSTWARPANVFEWLEHWKPCRGWLRLSRAASFRTPKFVR